MRVVAFALISCPRLFLATPYEDVRRNVSDNKTATCLRIVVRSFSVFVIPKQTNKQKKNNYVANVCSSEARFVAPRADARSSTCCDKCVLTSCVLCRTLFCLLRRRVRVRVGDIDRDVSARRCSALRCAAQQSVFRSVCAVSDASRRRASESAAAGRPRARANVASASAF